MVVPHLIGAMGLILAYPSLHGGFWLLAVAHVIITLPFAIWPILTALMLFDARSHERAARTLGAGPTARFLLVVAPNLF